MGTDLTNFQNYVDPYGDCKVNGRNSNTTLDPAIATTIPLFRDGNPYTRFWSVLSSLNMTYDADTISFTSVTSYSKFRASYLENFDYTALGSNFSANRSTSETFSQELRARSNLEGPVNATIGLFYEHEKLPFQSAVLLNQLGIDPATGTYMDWGEIFRAKGSTYSAFGADLEAPDFLRLERQGASLERRREDRRLRNATRFEA
ncbi:MAG: hypothetical protein EOP21_03710, partial [Hyphomicrobiales bacterium]